MEPKYSLPCSQQPNTSPYPEPAEYASNPVTLFLKDTFQYLANSTAQSL
jgi:hypothetical protein